MLKLIGVAALVVLVASESFAFFGAVFWAVAEFLHLGKLAEEGALGLSMIIAIACGYWIYRSAMTNAVE